MPKRNSAQNKPKQREYDIIVKEEVYHRFTSKQLPASLRRLIKKDPALEEIKTNEALADWFCNLNNPYAEAEYAEVSERYFSIDHRT